MSFIKRILNIIIAPLKNKMKMQRRINTLEIEKVELEYIIKSRITETLMRTLENQDEVERLKKENTRLRSKVKDLKGGLKSETK